MGFFLSLDDSYGSSLFLMDLFVKLLFRRMKIAL